VNSTQRKKENDVPSQRLWVVSEVYYPEQTSTGYYLTELAERLAETFLVTVLCGQPNYSIRGTKAPKQERRQNVNIFRAPGTTLDRNVLAFRLINMVTLGMSMFWRAIRQFRRTDKVLVVTTPPSAPFIIAFASLLRGASYYLLIHDLYPEVLIAVGKFKRNSLAVRLIDFLNRWLYKHATKIIVVGRDMKTLVEAKSNGLDVPVVFIPNWAEIDAVKPVPREENPLIHELGLNSKLIILHAGNIGYPTDVETIIECLGRLDNQFHFVFIGSGVKKQQLAKALRRGNVQNLTLLDPRPRHEQAEFLNACDIGLVTLVKGMYGAAMPSKTYNIMAAGKPVLAITDDDSELARVIDEDQIGWHVSAEKPGELAAILQNIFANREMLCSIGLRARSAAEQKYSIESALQNYLKVLC
jgi:glycosyltransferase involved in cell wall biosynthesis